MNTGLNTLSQELKQDFISRREELNTLRTRTRMELKTEREHRRQIHHTCYLKRKNECEEIRDQVQDLLSGYRIERKNLRASWYEQCKQQTRELNKSAKERYASGQTWNETVSDIRRIRRGG